MSGSGGPTPQIENEEVLRTKIRLMRTAMDRMARAAEHDGLFGDEILGLTMAIEDVVQACETALEKKRNGEL